MTMLKTLRREVTAAIANLLDGTAEDEEMILARAIVRGYFAMCFRFGMRKRATAPDLKQFLSSIHCAIGRGPSAGCRLPRRLPSGNSRP